MPTASTAKPARASADAASRRSAPRPRPPGGASDHPRWDREHRTRSRAAHVVYRKINVPGRARNSALNVACQLSVPPETTPAPGSSPFPAVTRGGIGCAELLRHVSSCRKHETYVSCGLPPIAASSKNRQRRKPHAHEALPRPSAHARHPCLGGRHRLEAGRPGPRQAGRRPARRRLPRRLAAHRPEGHARRRRRSSRRLALGSWLAFQPDGRPGDGHGRPRAHPGRGQPGDEDAGRGRDRDHRAAQPPAALPAGDDVHARRGAWRSGEARRRRSAPRSAQSKTPLAAPPRPAPAPRAIDLDTAAIERALGHKGKANGGVYQFSHAARRAGHGRRHGGPAGDGLGRSRSTSSRPARARRRSPAISC